MRWRLTEMDQKAKSSSRILLCQRRQLQKAHPQHVFHPQIDFSPGWFLHFALSRNSKTTNSRRILGINSDFMGWHGAERIQINKRVVEWTRAHSSPSAPRRFYWPINYQKQGARPRQMRTFMYCHLLEPWIKSKFTAICWRWNDERDTLLSPRWHIRAEDFCSSGFFDAYAVRNY